MQTTAFWAVPYEDERQSFVQFRSFTAENYKKIKQKEHEKQQNFRLRSSTISQKKAVTTHCRRMVRVQW